MKNSVAVTIEQARKDGNSNVNQDIKGQFVGRHVYTCATSLVEYILQVSQEQSKPDAPFTFEDIENLYSPKENQIKYIIDMDERGDFSAHVENKEGQTIWEINTESAQQLTEDGFIKDLRDVQNIASYLLSIGKIDTYTEVIEEGEEFEEESAEIYEYWIVSDFLYNKLQEQGQPVVTDGYIRIWGRTCSGQAILLDYVITKICADMEILKGQANSWERK